jgi:hypothetical protein
MTIPSKRPPVFLALLWGHLPQGIIRVSRPICNKYERPVKFALARSSSTGKPCSTVFSTRGSYHIQTKTGPLPVSLVELCTYSPTSIPLSDCQKLHSISLGSPIVGDNLYTKYEKLYNPVVRYPDYKDGLLIQEWISTNGDVNVDPSTLYTNLVDAPAQEIRHSILLENLGRSDIPEFPGESSNCSWSDHPESVKVRRDRGRPPSNSKY